MTKKPQSKPHSATSLDRWLTAIAVVSAVGLIIFIVFRNEKFADPNIVVLVRILLSICAAILGATIPGFLEVHLAVWQNASVRASSACAFFVIAYIFTPTVLPNESPPAPVPAEKPKETSLKLRIEPYVDDPTEKEGPHKGLGEFVAFTLSNPLAGLAIIDSVSLEVIDICEDKYAMTQTFMKSYKYETKLNPKSLGKTVEVIRKSFTYAPGTADRILILVNSDQEGIDYIARVIVKWHDDVNDTARVTTSELVALKFPSIVNDGLSRDEVGRLAEKHAEQLRQRMDKLAEGLKNRK